MDETRTLEALAALLRRIDGRGYKAYGDARGAWSGEGYTLVVDHVQADPFASPSRVSALLPAACAALPTELLTSPERRVGVAALLARSFAAAARGAAGRAWGPRGAPIHMEDPGQRVGLQTAVQIAPDGALEARFTVALPGHGRRVDGREAEARLARRVPALIDACLRAGAHEAAALQEAAETNEDADALRMALEPMGLVAFVADGARLARQSGVDDRPRTGERVVAFRSPDSLRVEVELPNAGRVTGMGVKRGVTLVVGGGFHGKSTLLRALERGVQNHSPGDGRERVVTVEGAVKVRAEDGRSVSGVDISPFIDGLPFGEDTTAFSTLQASGSTSQAAAVMEALEAGATTLLVDEDTAATNFMIRDHRMQTLVARGAEPITPFLDRVRDLLDGYEVSTVLVVGGSGDYLDVADTVISMRDYAPFDVTEQARDVAASHPTGRVREVGRPFGPRPARIPLPASVNPRRGKRDVSVGARGTSRILFGTEDIDLSAVEPEVSPAQARAIALALAFARERFMDGERALPEILDQVEACIERDGLDALDPRRGGDLARFRRFELAAALNRLRTLRVKGQSHG